MRTDSRTRLVRATPEETWALLADFGDIARWAPVVDHSSIQRSPGDGEDAHLGLTRRVQMGRRTVLERVERWEEPTGLAYVIEGLPKALRSVRNEWTLAPAGAGTTTVTLTTTVDCGPRPPQQVLAGILARRLAATVSDQLLAGLATALENAPNAPTRGT